MRDPIRIAGRLILVASLMATGASTLVAQRDFGSGEHHREVTWHDESREGRAKGLYAIRVRPDFFTVRLLVETPDGSRMIVTQTLDPRTGIEQTALSDDTSGWWAQLTKHTGVRAKALGEYFDSAVRELRVGEGKHFSLLLATATGFRFETQVPVLDSSETSWAFVEQLAANGSVAELSDAIPPALFDAILFLDSSLSPEPLPWREPDDNLAHSLRLPIAMLAGALRHAPHEGLRAPAQPWSMSVGPAEKGLAITNPALLQLVAGFRSVGPARLLPHEPQR